MMNEPISPELKKSIGKFFERVIHERYFHFPKIENLFLTGLNKLLSDAKIRKNLIACLQEESQRNFNNKDLEAKMNLFFALSIEKENDETLKNECFALIKKKPFVLRNAVQEGYKFGNYSTVKLLTDAAYDSEQGKEHLELFDEIRLDIALAEQIPSEIALFAAKRILTNPRMIYFHHFRAQFEGESEEVRALIKRIENLPDTSKRNLLLAEIYAEEGDFEKLIKLVEREADWTFVKKYSGRLFDFDKKRTVAMVWAKTDAFLEDHVGTPPVMKIKNLLRDLYENDAPGVARYLLARIREKYKKRKPLIDELYLFR